jgi:hypothetical protein
VDPYTVSAMLIHTSPRSYVAYLRRTGHHIAKAAKHLVL